MSLTSTLTGTFDTWCNVERAIVVVGDDVVLPPLFCSIIKSRSGSEYTTSKEPTAKT